MLCPKCGWQGARAERGHLECFMCGYRDRRRLRTKAKVAPVPKGPPVLVLIEGEGQGDGVPQAILEEAGIEFFSLDSRFAREWGLDTEAIDDLRTVIDIN
jgi:hypothetical protein